MSLHSLVPLRPGIMTSEMTRSGRWRLTSAQASSPSSAVKISNSSCRRPRMNCRSSPLSSASRMRARRAPPGGNGLAAAGAWAGPFGSAGATPLGSSARRRPCGSWTAASRRSIVSGRIWSLPNGRNTVNVVPAPSVLAASIVPPCSSTSSLARARPIPTPPSRRCSALETWKNRSNTRESALAGIPGPVSRTTTWTPSARSSTRISIAPPTGVNLRALPTRLVRTISRRCASAKIFIGEGSAASVKVIDRESAAGMLFSCTVAASARMSTSARLSRSPPASRRERSRRSSIRRSSR